MTDPDIAKLVAEMRARLAAADHESPGEWRVVPNTDEIISEDLDQVARCQYTPVTQFIGFVKNNLPALLNALDARWERPETAPRDRSDVLLAFKSGAVTIGSWDFTLTLGDFRKVSRVLAETAPAEGGGDG